LTQLAAKKGKKGTRDFHNFFCEWHKTHFIFSSWK